MSALPADARERAELLAGLRASPPRVSPRYFYDATGSKLFDQITRTKEYYPTRTELGILEHGGAALAHYLPRGAAVIELGSGSGEKILTLLRHLHQPLIYRPIDISKLALDNTAALVRRVLPALSVSPFEGDFTAADAYLGLPVGAPKLVYYSGSTIGNFDPPEAVRFLIALRQRLAPGDVLLLAADLIKDKALLEAAYNDAAGVTARFNQNLLHHLNARFEGDFRPEHFQHSAFYNQRERRIEMHLVPLSHQRVRLADELLSFSPELPIHTESSYKFDLDSLAALAKQSGFLLRDVVCDDRRWFAEAIMEVPREVE